MKEIFYTLNVIYCVLLEILSYLIYINKTVLNLNLKTNLILFWVACYRYDINNKKKTIYNKLSTSFFGYKPIILPVEICSV